MTILVLTVLKNNELSTLSLSSLPSRQGMNIGNIATDSNNVPPPDSSTSPSSLQEQDLPSPANTATTNAAGAGIYYLVLGSLTRRVPPLT
ncbi:MAG: hypothetical protein ACRD8W_08620 [Nitrososphaeraceae archaeon]